MDKQRKMDAFTWQPPRPRTDLYSRPLPNQKIDPRTPFYWLSRDGDELYFINESSHSLPLVSCCCGGWVAGGGSDGGVSGNELVYRDVLPKEAVKIDSFCSIADQDLFLCNSVKITRYDGTTLHYETYPVRGGSGECVLRWDTKETGKGARLITTSKDAA